MNKKILVVEDDRDCQKLIQYQLSDMNCHLSFANNGHKARELLENFLPDLILLDVMMPELDGLTLCRLIKSSEQWRHIPIIIMTAHHDTESKLEAVDLGADDFIAKPFEGVDLQCRIRSLLRLKGYYDQLERQNQQLEMQKTLLEKDEQFKEALTQLIAHDMKNPLNIIQGNLQLMNMFRNNSDFDEQVYTERIDHSARRLLRMILNLVDVSRLNQNQLTLNALPIDLSSLFVEIERGYQNQSESANKTLQINEADETLKVRFDWEFLERMVYNIFDYGFSKAKGPSHIQIDVQKHNEQKIQIDFTSTQNAVSSERLQQLIENRDLSQIDLKGHNSGQLLGLAFCARAAELGGGKLTAENDTGKSFLRLCLPGVCDEALDIAYEENLNYT